MSGKHSPRQYRKAAFSHWLNLSFLGVGVIAGAVIDPAIWLVMAPLELGALWVLPDLPMFRAAVDTELDKKALMREREYFMRQLWGLRPVPQMTLGRRIKALFTETQEESLEARVLNTGSPSFHTYMELKQIIAKLEELEKVRGTQVLDHELERLDQVVNGYLRFTMAQRALATARDGLDVERLHTEIAQVEAHLRVAPPDMRGVLEERRRLCMTQLERYPKLEAMYNLFKVRADSIVHQMRSLHSQALADPRINVNTMLDDMIERQDLLSDPVAAIEGNEDLVRELLGGSAVISKASQASQASGAAHAAGRERG